MNVLTRAAPLPTDALASGRETLATEIAGLAALSASLGEAFVRAASMLGAIEGRIVVTGIGKSGHVGRKIAATLASTGSPALFVHATEASHGDMGMVLPGDALLAVSNSGETAELADIVAHAKRFGLPLVAITARRGSALARAAAVVLLLPDAAEACPMGLAPTTSTTMQIALGDALAIALLRQRGFSPERYHEFHPGGSLGAKLRRVSELMHTGDALPLVGPDTAMSSALLTMTAKRFGCLGVCEPRGRLLGIVTDGDLREAMGPGLLDRTAGAVMNATPRVTFAPDRLAADALRVMNDAARPVTSAFVLGERGEPLGILHIHDLLRAGVA